MSEIVIQAIGFLGLLFFIISYQIRSNKVLFLCQLMGCVVFCIQMLLLGAYTGAVSLLVNILRNILLLKINDWKWVKSRWTLTAVIALLTAVTAYTWSGALSLLPFASVAVTSIGYWTDNAQKIRLSQLIGSPCTLLYDIFVKTWGGAISEGMTIVSIIVSIVRFGWNDLDDKKLA
ncbi:MAG: YgjV family protein [Oscillospiraceae bacterium]|nr:YgjV family protein [Oscillospiraceae bacterium]MBQ4538739.1 YgjV family protein [Oscillospiraceae bacterium]